jgi:hypothetical protein
MPVRRRPSRRMPLAARDTAATEVPHAVRHLRTAAASLWAGWSFRAYCRVCGSVLPVGSSAPLAEPSGNVVAARHLLRAGKGAEEIRRALAGLAGAAFILLALAGPASAAPAHVTHFKLSGTVADALWFTSSAASSTFTSVNASRSSQGPRLVVDQVTQNYDASGNFAGGTRTLADVANGFSFTLRQPLASASISGTALPATTCAFDANFNTIGCSATTIGVSVTWTGQGAITRGWFNEHFKNGGFSEIDHFYGTNRHAVATGIVGGLTLSTSELQFADLGTFKSDTVTVCVGSGC